MLQVRLALPLLQFSTQIISVGVRGAAMEAASVVITFEDVRYEDKEVVSEENPVEVLETLISKLCENMMNTLDCMFINVN